MENLRGMRKAYAAAGMTGLAAAALVGGPLGALIGTYSLIGSAAGAAIAETRGLIDPERPYKVEEKERQREPKTEEEKKRYGEIADSIISKIEKSGEFAKALGGYALEKAGDGIKQGYQGARDFAYKVKEAKERRQRTTYERTQNRADQRMTEEEINSELKSLVSEYTTLSSKDHSETDPRFREIISRIQELRGIKNSRKKFRERGRKSLVEHLN